MYNYRRVLVSTSKFKHVYGNFYSPIWINGRVCGVEVIAFIISMSIASRLNWFTMSTLSYGVGLVLASCVAVYFLDKHIHIEELPFENTVFAFIVYIFRYKYQKKQVYQDERLNSNRNQFQIL
ncbi:hypothetical protein R55227_BLOPHJLP_01600 [Fructobacillus tropaeoli]|uniref:MFS transporter permease n=1 Tax=Fructobacillus tropaeoli TaxID=709323 RepID=UPI002D84801D|nr:hypothetical protein R55227_BLOPHJLP_01600 [Fructobacillus tropaeoli]